MMAGFFLPFTARSVTSVSCDQPLPSGYRMDLQRDAMLNSKSLEYEKSFLACLSCGGDAHECVGPDQEN